MFIKVNLSWILGHVSVTVYERRIKIYDHDCRLSSVTVLC